MSWTGTGSWTTEFLTANVQGFEQLKEQILPEYTPERVSELTGIPPKTVVDMARAYAAARAPFIRLGSGLSRYGNGAMTVRTIACLPAVVGAYGKPGGGCFPGTSTGGAFAMKEVLREDFMTKPTRVVNMNRLGHALNELDAPPVMGCTSTTPTPPRSHPIRMRCSGDWPVTTCSRSCTNGS